MADAFYEIILCEKGKCWAWTVLAGGVGRTGGSRRDERPLCKVSEQAALFLPAHLLAYV